MMSCKRWVIVFILTTLFPLVLSQFDIVVCSDGGNYTSESLYRADLRGILRSLSSNMNSSGFYSTSVGRANVVALCRADIQLNTCQSCVNIIAEAILVKCPNQFVAVMWSDFCMLRFSNETIFGRLATVPAWTVYGPMNVTNPVIFKAVRAELADDVRARAAIGGSLRKAAAGNRTGADGQGIFMLMQCMPDLTPDYCNSCLIQAAGYIPEYIDNKKVIRVYAASCIYHYENQLFYNVTKLEEPLAPALTPPLAPPPLVPPSSLAPPPSFVPPSLVPPPPPAKNNTIIIIVVVPVVAFLFLALGVGIFVKKRMTHKATEIMINPDFPGDINTIESIQHDFGKIRAATNNFSDDNKLGQGGFGAVYMGKMVNGQEIAVKRLSKDSGQGDLEFKNEVLLLAKLQHRNLVRLLGFSIEGIERLLIYEFVANGSLDQILLDRTKSSKLDWDSRYRILVGIAKGVLYLHEDSRLMIIHRDLKASNVLLDEYMNPKIADFGLARLVVPDETIPTTKRIVGTYGYMAPEYASYGHFSVKSDVFSFGVIVLEIITGQRKIFTQNGENLRDLLSCAWRSWRDGTTANMIDPILRETCGGQPDMVRCIHIALLCVQQNAGDRPTMASVVVMLNSSTITLPIPKEPGFYFSRTSIPHLKYSSNQLEPSNTQPAQLPNNKYSSVIDLYPQ